MKDLHKKITQGEWGYQTSLLIKGSIIHAGDYNIAEVYGQNDMTIAQSSINAEAICKAINNTYGKGVDPEKISELINCFSDLCGLVAYFKISEIKFDEECDKRLNNAMKALESIKLEDK